MSEIIDTVNCLMDFYDDENSETDIKTPEDALVDCINKFGVVDMRYLADVTGLTYEAIAFALRGVIFQKPDLFLETGVYDPAECWVLSETYLNGNASNSLRLAKAANKKFRSKFDSNIEALRNILPLKLSIDEIHIGLGASWIPAHEYALFIKDFLGLKNPPIVRYNKDFAKWEVDADKTIGYSVLNNITYGVSADNSLLYSKQYLTAIDIIEQTLNAKTIKVFDYQASYTGKVSLIAYEPVINKNKTVEAQEKQRKIIEAFNDWVYAKRSRLANFEDYYNNTLVGYTFSAFNGSFLRFPGLNPEVKFYDHQKNAIARVLLSGKNVLFAHDVGTGKTYEMVASVHELKRLNISQKNMVVVPNNILKATVEAHQYLYPDDKIYVIYPNKFTPAKRKEVLKEVREGDYTAIYIAYSSFDMIVMSKAYYIRKYEEEIRAVKVALNNSSVKHERKLLRKKVNKLREKLDKYIAEKPECEWDTFDMLGIETLVVDEAHNYKNIPITSRVDNIVGMSKNGSKKCCEMLEKARYVKRLIFATGTPLTNSLADLYTFQVYLQPELLKLHNLYSFDTWINTFGKRETSIECDVDSNSKSLRTVTRFSSFHNLSELMSIFAQVCDFHHIGEEASDLPEFKGYTDISVPKSDFQKAYIDSLSKRTDLIRSHDVSRDEDNLLKITIDGRKVALDIRLIDPDLEEEDEICKVDACAAQIVRLYKMSNDSVQIVFSDIGTPKKEFNIYDALKFKLIESGVKSEEIAFVHDAITETARAKMFADMNKGKLRVVIGSTAKLGVGVNVQEKLIALHHLSIPWRPADMVQREGRILRKGNTCEEVYIFRYITEGSFDAYSWQLLENKQKFISSFLSGTSDSRAVQDIADAVLTYSEVKALAIGNPLIKKRVEVANLLERTKAASRTRHKQLQTLQTVISMTPAKIKELEKMSKIAMEDYAHYKSSKQKIPNEERIAFGEELLYALKHNIMNPKERGFEDYQGFDIVLPSYMAADNMYVLIKSSDTGAYRCEIKDDTPPLGCGKIIEYLLDHLGERAEKLKAEALNLKRQIAEAKADYKKGNPYLKEIEDLKESLEQIDKAIEEDCK